MSIGCVIVGRNDNYGGYQKERAAYAINSCIQTYDEVIFVDWNTYNEKTLIEEIGDNLIKSGKLRCIIVTPEEHRQFTNGYLFPQPCSEVLGRNVGLRRLTTEYMASTNVDEINPPRRFLNSKLQKNTMIAVARHGLQLETVLRIDSPLEIDNIRESLLKQTFPQAFPIKMTEDDIWSLVAWCGDLQIAHRDVWYAVRGYSEWQLGVGYHDSYIQRKAMEAGYLVMADYEIPLWHLDHYKRSDSTEYCAGEDPSCLLKHFSHEDNNENWGKPLHIFKEFII